MIWCVAVVFIGILTNSLEILIFNTGEMRKRSFSIYLTALAASDSLYLVTFTLAHIFIYIKCMYMNDSTVLSLYHRKSVACKVLQLSMDAFSDFSSLLILAFTIERYIACYHSLRLHWLCTRRSAIMFCMFAFVVIICSITYPHVMFIDSHQCYKICTILPKNKDQFFYFYIVEVILFRLIPIILIAILNTLILKKLFNLQNARKLSTTLDASTQISSTNYNKQTRISIMLLTVSTAYIVLYLPAIVNFILDRFIVSGQLDISHSIMAHYDNLSEAMGVTGFAINFFLYTMSGQTFREHLFQIISRYRL